MEQNQNATGLTNGSNSFAFASVLVFALSYCCFLSMGTVNLCFNHIPFSYSTLPLVQDPSADRPYI